MAWRLHNHLLRGELDFTQRGLITGTLWFVGRESPVTLDLTGTPWQDLAGHRLTFTNPSPASDPIADALSPLQHGTAGDITASRKVKVPDCTDDELTAHLRQRTPFPWHWGNALYLEWYSHTNGRIVIESATYQLTLDPVAAWTLTEADETTQQAASTDAMTGFMTALTSAETEPFTDYLPPENEPPTSPIEAQADAETARMDLLLDRVTRRLKDEDSSDPETFERILEEERQRLRQERGEPDPIPLTPEQEAEHARWIDEMNAAADEALEELENDPNAWKEPEKHPLVEPCFELGTRLQHDAKTAGWTANATSSEHPILEIINGIQIASAKLAGALNGTARRGEWPPNPLFAGDTLVRLKKARQALQDAKAAAHSSLEDALAPRTWLEAAQQEIIALLNKIEALITEVRNSLE